MLKISFLSLSQAKNIAAVSNCILYNVFTLKANVRTKSLILGQICFEKFLFVSTECQINKSRKIFIARCVYDLYNNRHILSNHGVMFGWSRKRKFEFVLLTDL